MTEQDGPLFKDMIIEISGEGRVDKSMREEARPGPPIQRDRERGDGREPTVVSKRKPQCTCRDEDHPDPKCPLHGYDEKEKSTFVAIDDEGPCTCPAKDVIDPYCPEHGTYRTDGTRRPTCTDKPCSCPSSREVDPYCQKHGRCKRKAPPGGIGDPCCCPEGLLDPYCPEHGRYNCDGSKRPQKFDGLTCTCDPWCPIHGKRAGPPRRSPGDLGENCTCPASDVRDPFCPEHGGYAKTGRRRPGAYGNLCTCPSKSVVDPYCREHGIYKMDPHKRTKMPGLCSCPKGKRDPYCPEHGHYVGCSIQRLNVEEKYDPDCPIHGTRRLAQAGGRRDCTCSRRRVSKLKKGICRRICEWSPCCKCICETFCCRSACCKACLGSDHEVPDSKKETLSSDRKKKGICILDKSSEKRKRGGKKGWKGDACCQGTIELSSPHRHKRCGISIDVTYDKD